MIEFDQEAIAEAVEDFDEVAENLDEATDRSSTDSIYSEIADAVDREMVSPVLKRARELGRPHVGERVSEIQPVPGEWRGDTYVAGLRSNNDVVLSHEYGSGKYSSTGPYKIEPAGDNVLAFEVDGHPIFVEWVVHPGVRGKRFMRRAIRERSDEILEEALDATQQTLSDAFDTQ